MLKEGEDFYFENGLMVFTEKYHLDRGYCCGNRCRHCPYNYINVKRPKSGNAAPPASKKDEKK